MLSLFFEDRSIGAVSKHLKTLKSGDVKSKTKAARALWNLLEAFPEYREEIKRLQSMGSLLQTIAPSELGLTQNITGLLLTLTSDDVCTQEIKVSGGIKILMKLLTSSSLSVQQNAFLVLLKISQVPANKREMQAEGLIKSAVLLSRHSDRLLNKTAAEIFESLAADAENQLSIGQEGGIPALLALLGSADTDTRCAALRALKQISQKPVNRKSMGEVERLRVILTRLNDGVLMVRILAAELLTQLAEEDAHKLQIVKIGAVALLSGLSSPSEDVLKSSCALISILSCARENKELLRQQGALVLLLQLCEHADRTVRNQALEAVCHLGVGSFENQAEITLRYGIEKILGVLSDQQNNTIHVAMLSLISALAYTNENYQTSMMTLGVIPLVLGFLGAQETDRVRLLGIGILKSLSQHAFYLEKMKESKAVSFFGPVLTASSIDIKSEALDALLPMIEGSSEVCAQLNESVGMSTWVQFLSQGRLQERSLRALMHLCVEAPMVTEFVNNKGIAALFALSAGLLRSEVRQDVFRLVLRCASFQVSIPYIAGDLSNVKALIKYSEDSNAQLRQTSLEILKILESKMEYAVQIAKIKGVKCVLVLLEDADIQKRRLMLKEFLPLCQPAVYQTIKERGIRALAVFLKEDDTEACENALKALIAIASNDLTQVGIADSVEIESVANLLASGRPLSLRQNAVRLLELLAAPHENKFKLCKVPGVLSNLFLLLYEKNIELSHGAIAVLRLLAVNTKNRAMIAENKGVEKLLSRFAVFSSDVERLKKLSETCGYLSESEKNISLFGVEAIDAVKILFGRSDPEILGHGISIVFNMLAISESSERLSVASKIVAELGQKLVSLLTHTDATIWQKTVGVVSKLVSTQDFAMRLSTLQVFTPLLGLLGSKDRVIQDFASSACYHLFTYDPQETIKLGRSKAPEILYPLLSDPVLLLRSRAVAMFHFLMAADKEMASEWVKKGIGKIWATLLMGAEEMCYHTVCMVHLAASEEGNRAQLSKDGVIKPLIGVLTSGSAKAHLEALNALNFLALQAENKGIIGQEGGIPSLLRFLSGAALLRQKAIIGITLLAKHDPNKEKIYRSIPMIIQLLANDNDPVIKQHAASVLEMLVADSKYGSEILNPEALRACLNCLSDSGQNLAYVNAAQAVRAIIVKLTVMEHPNKRSIVTQAVMDQLCGLLSPRRSGISSVLMHALYLLAKDPTVYQSIAASSQLDKVFVFLADESIVDWKQAIEIFDLICADEQCRRAMGQQNLIERLMDRGIALLVHQQPEIRVLAAHMLQKLALDHERKAKLASETGIKHLFHSLSDAHAAVRLSAAHVFAKLALDPSLQDSIVQSGAIKIFLDWIRLKSKDESERFVASKVLLELGRSPKYLYVLIESGAGPIFQQILMGESHDGIRINCSELFQNLQRLLQQPVIQPVLQMSPISPSPQKVFSSSTSQRTASTKVPSYESTDIELSSFEQALQALPVKAEPLSELTDTVKRIHPSEVKMGALLGEGGFGTVYAAEYNHETVAVKCCSGAIPSEKDLKKIKEEILKMQNLDQKYLVRLRGVIEVENELPRLVMDCGIRGSLFNYLRSSQKIPWSWRLRTAEELARGLAYLHDEKINIIHRDIKSLNVVLDDDLHAKWCDFGLASLKANATATATKGGRKGTLNWMAPELFQGREGARKESDIWSFGMLLFELATRGVPYKGLKEVMIVRRLSAHQAETVPNVCKMHIPKYASLMEMCWKEYPQRPRAQEMVVTLMEAKAEYMQSHSGAEIDDEAESPQFASGFVGLTMG